MSFWLYLQGIISNHMKRLLLMLAAVLFLAGSACKENRIPLPPDTPTTKPDPKPEPEPEEVPVYLKVDEKLEIHALDFSKSEPEEGIFEYVFSANGADPYFHLEKFEEELDPYHVVLDFEYMLNSAQEMQIYYCTPGASEPKSVKMNLKATTVWTRFSYDMEMDIENFGFGSAGHRLRLDIGNDKGVNFSLRKIHIRKATAAEQAEKQDKIDGILARKRKAADLKKYLSSSFSDKITSVTVTKDNVTITGMVGSTDCYLVEIMPSGDVTDNAFPFTKAISAKFLTGIPGHQHSLGILTPAVEIYCTTCVEHHCHMIVAGSELIDELNLSRRQAERPVEAFAFDVAVKTAAENHAGGSLESSHERSLVEEAHLASCSGIREIVVELETESVFTAGLNLEENGSGRNGVIAPVTTEFHVVHKETIAVVASHIETDRTACLRHENALPAT